MSEALKQAKQEVLKGCRLTCEKNFTVGTAGNISARVLGEDRFVITPTSMDYNRLTEEDLVVIDMDGHVVEGKWKPSIEHNLHRYIFKNRPDVNAVVHVHSTYAPLTPPSKELRKCWRWILKRLTTWVVI